MRIRIWIRYDLEGRIRTQIRTRPVPDAQDWPEAGEVHVLADPRQRLAHHQVSVRAQVLHNLHNVYIYSVAA
jgi:hypothetical protein